MTILLDLNLISGPLVITVYAVSGLALVLLVAAFTMARPSGRIRRLVLAAAALLVGLAVGLSLAAMLGGPDGEFGVDFTPVTRAWVGFGFGGIAVAAVVLVHALMPRRRIRRAVASLAVAVLVFATAAMSVNIDFGQYPTVRSALGISAYSDSAMPLTETGDHSSIADWKPPANMPTAGTVYSVTIPGTASHFAPREGVVYLPPAALTEKPPLLPVMVMLSGQPGMPSDTLSNEKLQQRLDAYAAEHAGLAPILVGADQLGDRTKNPMCIDSPLGNSATYMTVDVPNWIHENLPVLSDPHYWAIGGLSQGGTCAIQFGAGYPQVFGNIIDASGELAPTLGNRQTTITQGFGGNEAAYEAAKPENILAKNAPYKDSFALFGVGANDNSYLPHAKKLSEAARAAGIDTVYFEVQGSAHDVASWSATFAKGLELLAKRWELVPAS